MKKKFFYFVAFATCALSVTPAFGTTMALSSMPSGQKQITLVKGSPNWFSLPLTGQTVFTGTVSGVTGTSISVAGSTTTFTGNLAAAGSPYFLQFLSGAEAGRTMLVTANSTTSLTLDTTDDGIGSAVALNTSGYCVAVGDNFQIFAGDTLASVFGAGTSSNPLVLVGGVSQGNADEVMLCGPSLVIYYFNTKLGYWVQGKSTTNANNTIIYPYSAVCVYRTATSNTTLVFNGQVTPVNACTKIATNVSIYSSTHYPTGVTLGQISFGSNWVKTPLSYTADNVGLWNPATDAFTFYYQQPNGNWYLCNGGTALQNSVTIPAGAATVLYKRTAVVGTQPFLVSSLPYTP